MTINLKMSYPQKLKEALEFFDTLTDQTDRVNVLLDYAKKFKEVPASIAVRPFDKAHQIPQCESESYVWTIKQTDGTLKFYFAVENPSGVSAKALARVLDETLSGEKPEVIATVSEEIVYKIFRQNISMGKGLGLMSMVQSVVALAKREISPIQSN
jgi:cysteine desulfuration protein SufE